MLPLLFTCRTKGRGGISGSFICWLNFVYQSNSLKIKMFRRRIIGTKGLCTRNIISIKVITLRLWTRHRSESCSSHGSGEKDITSLFECPTAPKRTVAVDFSEGCNRIRTPAITDRWRVGPLPLPGYCSVTDTVPEQDALLISERGGGINKRSN